MNKISIGCAGWDYKDWVGPFYPKNLERQNYLAYYAKFFRITEINSTFYNLPSIDTVNKWNSRVPPDFRFIIKMWQKITHNLNESGIGNRINQFLRHIEPLKNKTAGILMQFPPWFKYSEKNLSQLKFLINKIPLFIRQVIELRDNSWLKTKILSKFIDGNRIILGTTYIPNISPFYKQNQNSYYIRLIGDRELTVFNRIQRNQEEAIKHLEYNIQKLNELPNIYEIFIIVNNHFAGFAPETANLIKGRLGLEFHDFDKQKKIFDYLT
ncbi:MAG: DUF72 domain-containing protein [Candidatus Hodarchaeota archaeon]